MYESNTVGSVKEWLSVLIGVHVKQANLRETLGDIRRDRIKVFVITGCSIPKGITLRNNQNMPGWVEGGEGGRGGHGLFGGVNSRIDERMGAVSPDKRENTLENVSSNLQP